MLNKAHVIQLRPTKAQRTLFHMSFGCRRHSFNWALVKWKELYEAGGNPNAMSLIKLQNSIKKVEMPFYLKVNKCAIQYACWDLENAWKKYFKGLKDGTLDAGKKAYIKERLSRGLPIDSNKLKNFGKPNFKKKGIKDRYVAIDNSTTFKQKDKKIWIPRIGWVSCHENLRFEGKVNNVVIKRIADKYFAVVNLITNNIPTFSENQATVGVDLGIKTLLVCSDGKTFENPKALKSNLKSLKRLQKGLERKVKGSNNQQKQKTRIARKHYRISCIRKNAIHNATNYLVKNYKKIVVERLNVKGMVKNHKLAQAINDASFGIIIRQLNYKAIWNNVELVIADPFFPSSKLCSCCGNKKESLKLSERIYKCEVCNINIDRDLNAAINLANYSPATRSVGSKACGDTTVKKQSCSEKHEININKVLNKLN